MSNKAKKLANEIKMNNKLKELALNTTLPGTIVLTAAILSGHTFDEAQEYFNNMEKLKRFLPKTTFEMVDKVFNDFNVSKEGRAQAIMLFDMNNVRPPMVSYVINDEVMPLHYKGYTYGLINDARKAKDNVAIEYLYDEDGEPYKDDDEERSQADDTEKTK